MKIEIHIDELVLHGFDAVDRYAIGDAVSAELARLIAEQGSPALFTHSLHIPSLQMSPVQIAPGAVHPEGVGAQVANQLYQSLNHPSVEAKSLGSSNAAP
jgi:hypothetical protein